MKKCLALTLCIILGILAARAQPQLWKTRRWEGSVGVGPSFFFGDVGGFTSGKNILGIKDLNYRQTRFDINGNIKYRIINSLSARISLSYIMLHGSDDRGTNEGRELEMTSSIFEPALIAEYYFIKNQTENTWGFQRRRSSYIQDFFKSIDVYVFAGFGGASYNAKGNQELRSRNIKSSGFTAVLPAGLGTQLVYTPELNFGLEVGGRYTFSDYLDGYTSQYSKSNDVYYFLNLTVTYKPKMGRNGLPVFRR